MAVALIVLLNCVFTTPAAYGQGTTVTKIIPHIAAGSFDNFRTDYNTTFLILNTAGVPITISAQFYMQNGAPSGLSYSKYMNGVFSSFNGQMAPTPLAVNGMIVLDVGTSTMTGRVNSGVVYGHGNFSVVAAFDLNNRVPTVISRVGSPTSAADMRQFVIPRLSAVSEGRDVGFAVVNTGATPVTITVTLRSENGAVVATKDLNLGARSHTNQFTGQFFGSLINESGPTLSSLHFSSSSAQVAAMALITDGDNLTSLGIERRPATRGAALRPGPTRSSTKSAVNATT